MPVGATPHACFVALCSVNEAFFCCFVKLHASAFDAARLSTMSIGRNADLDAYSARGSQRGANADVVGMGVGWPAGNLSDSDSDVIALSWTRVTGTASKSWYL